MSKILTGMVTANKADKTITVKVLTPMTHPIYKKKYSISKKFLAHDEKNEAQVGDQVSIIETRPISANKHFKLNKITHKAAIREEDKEIKS